MTESNILDQPYALTAEQVAFYRKHAFIKLKHVLPPDVIEHYQQIISQSVFDLNTMHVPLEERSTYDRAFLQVMNLWTQNEQVKPLVFSKRLAGVAAALMGTDGVRLYHDQALYKEPAGGFTPWHADQFYWPLSNENTTTVWIPLQATPLDMGPLEFSAGSNATLSGRDLGISDQSEFEIETTLAAGKFDHVVEPFDLGEVSFHSGWTFHRAGPNTTTVPRAVMTMIYMDRSMRLKAPENRNQQEDWDAWCPGATIGQEIDTPLNPVLFEN